jgi:hypothetical protein
MQRGSDQLKQAAAMLVVALIFYVPNTEKRLKSIDLILKTFA